MPDEEGVLLPEGVARGVDVTDADALMDLVALGEPVMDRVALLDAVWDRVAV